MIQTTKLIALVSASVLVAACGGGDATTAVFPTPTAPVTDNTPTDPTTNTPTDPTTNTPTDPTTESPADPTTNPPPTDTTDTETPPTEPTDPENPPVVVQQFTGHMELVANQILYLRTNRILYLPVLLDNLESDTGIVDMASGSPVAHYPNLEAEAASFGCTIEIDGTCAIQPPAVAPAAPIAAFGLRIGTHLLAGPGQTQSGAQTVVGRIAFDLSERADSPMIRAGEMAEIMRFVIDNVEMSTDETGRITNAQLRDGAQIHVYGRSAAGVEVRESIPAPAATVRLMPLTEIPDGYGDTTSQILFMDLETGFSRAEEKLAALKNIAGHFTMHVTLTAVEKIVRPASVASPGFPARPEKDLIGQPITVNTQEPVTGAGISGNAWIRAYP